MIKFLLSYWLKFRSPSTWTFGDFGPAKKEFAEACGGENKTYNIKNVSREEKLVKLCPEKELLEDPFCFWRVRLVVLARTLTSAKDGGSHVSGG